MYQSEDIGKNRYAEEVMESDKYRGLVLQVISKVSIQIITVMVYMLHQIVT
jgi:hypothetical protein